MTKKQIAEITKLVDQILEQRGLLKKPSLHPDVEKFAGIIPKEVEVRKEYFEHIEEKHK
ncbi:hypothetical protein HUU05_00720 [candidate division KSB1 bacterium]|nr:hypothetical protein [candidate division KSB1 bacterium]